MEKEGHHSFCFNYVIIGIFKINYIRTAQLRYTYQKIDNLREENQNQNKEISILKQGWQAY